MTLISSPTPTISPTTPPTREPYLLEIQNPTLEQLNGYLLAQHTDTFFFQRPIHPDATISYADLNGDTYEDLILEDVLCVVILLWQGNHYAPPFQILRLPDKYGSASRVQLLDWTLNGSPEVTFDYQQSTGGPGLSHESWHRNLIHCQATSCRTVWEGTLAARTNDYNAGGISLHTGELSLDRSYDPPRIRQIEEYFSIYSLGIYLPFEVLDELDFERNHLARFTSKLKIFEWNGQTFDLISEDILSLPKVIPSAAMLHVENDSGVLAHIKRIPITVPGPVFKNNDRCALYVEDLQLGEVFGCRHNFSTVEWRDVTGDGAKEIVVKALSGIADPEQPLELIASCFHERLLIYQLKNGQYEQVLNTYGCVVNSDLFGTRFEDVDQNGQLDVVVARWYFGPTCERKLNENVGGFVSCFRDLQYVEWIYKWNGSQFVYSDWVFGKNYSD